MTQNILANQRPASVAGSNTLCFDTSAWTNTSQQAKDFLQANSVVMESVEFSVLQRDSSWNKNHNRDDDDDDDDANHDDEDEDNSN